MQALPLYDADQRARVERSKCLDTSSGVGSCRRCDLGKFAGSVCIEPEVMTLGDDPRTLLLVGETPGMHEDRQGRPFSGVSGDFLRKEVEKHWRGRVVFDNALRCFGQGKKRSTDQTERYVAACRPYMADTIRLAQADRVVALGSVSVQSLLGRSVPPYSVRRGYGFLGDGTPVYLGINPAAAMRNRFVKRWFVEDLEWALTCENPVPTHWDAEYSLVETGADAERAARELFDADWFAFDTETAGAFGDSYFEVLCLAACAVGSDYPWVWDDVALRNPETREPLLEVMRSKAAKKVGHNIKHDMLAVRFGLGTEVEGIAFDTMHDARVLQADAKSRLEFIGELVGMGGHKVEALDALARGVKTVQDARAQRKRLRKTGGKGLLFLPGLEQPAIEAACRLLDLPPKTFAYALVPKPILLRYCALDTVTTVRIGERQRPMLRRSPAIIVSDDFITPATWAYEKIERNGMAASVKAIMNFNDYLAERRTKVLKQLSTFGDFDPSSRDQIEAMLFDKLGLPSKERDRTKSGKRGTGKKILSNLESKHPFVSKLIEFRRLDKLLGTYAEGFRPHVRADGRIHPNIKVTGTETGRPSCEAPNLQNLPRPKTVEGKLARNCFIAPPGRVLVEIDFSQIEIRVGAMLSNEQRMIAAFIADPPEDLHWKTTQIIARDAWGLDPAKMHPDANDKQRSESKVTTFGLMYGKTDLGLAEDLGISIERAGIIRRAILGGYPDFAAWCEEQELEARRTGETWTWWDGKLLRRRPLWQIGDAPERDGRPSRRAVTAANSAVNTPIQGTASDYTLRSVIEVVRACEAGHIRAKVVITIHDAIMLECLAEDAADVARQAGAIMTQWPTANGVPLVVDFKLGRAWGDLKKFDPAAPNIPAVG